MLLPIEKGTTMSSHQPLLEEGYYKKEGQWKITANHEIQKVTPDMIDWW